MKKTVKTCSHPKEFQHCRWDTNGMKRWRGLCGKVFEEVESKEPKTIYRIIFL